MLAAPGRSRSATSAVDAVPAVAPAAGTGVGVGVGDEVGAGDVVASAADGAASALAEPSAPVAVGEGVADGEAVDAPVAGTAEADRKDTLALLALAAHRPFVFTSVVSTGTSDPSDAFARVGTGVTT